MADGVTVKDATGTSTPVAADELTSGAYSGFKAQLIKVVYGADGDGVLASFGNGAADAGTPRVALASDSQVASGNVAHDAADSGNPLKIGGKAVTANPTPVASGDRVDAQFDKTGALITRGALRTLKGTQRTTITNDATETTIVDGGAAGVYRDIYMLMVSNVVGTDTPVVSIRDATAGTIRRRFPVPPGQAIGYALSVDSAVPQTVAASAWTIQSDLATITLDITVNYVEQV